MTNRAGSKRRRRTRPYPVHTLEDSLRVTEVIYGRGGSMNRVALAKSLGTTPTSSAFTMRLNSSSRYGLTERRQEDDAVALTARGESAAGPSRHGERQDALLAAALGPELFGKFYEAYDGQKLPADEMACNMLQRDFGVEAELTGECLGVIKANGLFAGLLGEVGGSLYVSAAGAHTDLAEDTLEPVDRPAPPIEQPPEPERRPPAGGILLGHVGATDIVRGMESILGSLGVACRVLELEGGATFDESTSEVTEACKAAVVLYAGPTAPPLDETTERRAREDALHMIGGATALFGSQALLVRERGLERLRQEATLETIQFRRESPEELALELLRHLRSMGIIEVRA